MEYDDVARAIVDGELDGHLDAFVKLVRDRKESVAKAAALALKPGDQVRLKEIRPKYLSGTVATVESVTDGKVVVSLPDDYELRRFAGATGCKIPLGSFEPVS